MENKVYTYKVTLTDGQVHNVNIEQGILFKNEQGEEMLAAYVEFVGEKVKENVVDAAVVEEVVEKE